ncbi:MAG: PilZ domain-containing protein, partial [Desulfuromonadales bacterium]|nr:PilZ domain-containing protein [Desulfuromonadales bacterium]
IMITAAGKPEEVRQCLQAGCDDYITKPVNTQELREKVQRLLGEVKRRSAERIPVKMPVELREGGRLHVARTEDLSSSGVYLKSPVPLEKNTTVEIRLESAEDKPLRLYGKIKRSAQKTEDGCGVYFIYPDPKSKIQLATLIRSKKAQQLQTEGVEENSADDSFPWKKNVPGCVPNRMMRSGVSVSLSRKIWSSPISWSRWKMSTTT